MIELEPLCRIDALVGPLTVIGVTPDGERRVVPILGGTVEGEGAYRQRLRGEVVPGGADWQFHRTDGVLDLDVHYLLRLSDDALVEVRGNGYRHGPPEVMERLAKGEPVAAAEYYFRTVMRFRTAAAIHADLNRMLAVATASRAPERVRLSVFRVL